MTAFEVDKAYCASSFLMHRTVIDRTKRFTEDLPISFFDRAENCDQIHDSVELEESLRRQVAEACAGKRVAVALSGGIDSAILARLASECGCTKAYTFKCVVPGIAVIDETPQAAKYAEHLGLDHEIVEITWEDVEAFAPALMLHKGAPIHSIEVQIYKAALVAKEAGFDGLMFGESADVNYGGQSGLFSGKWTFGQYVDRYTYLMPYIALKDSRLELQPYVQACGPDGYIDVLTHCSNAYFTESMGSYANATGLAGIELIAPFANTVLAVPMDYERIRRGENKYLVREVFSRLFPDWNIPEKLPLPRPTEEWLTRYVPHRDEFWPNCTEGLTGDQKWLVWALERFFDAIDER